MASERELGSRVRESELGGGRVREKELGSYNR